MQSCVLLYSCLKQYEKAVKLALKSHDVTLAKIQADLPDSDQIYLKKKLWLLIAKYLIVTKKDYKEAMSLLQFSSSSFLSLQDLLPFFPDFVTIDDFQEPICKALKEYNSELEELKEQLSEAVESAEHIRLDLREFKQR